MTAQHPSRTGCTKRYLLSVWTARSSELGGTDAGDVTPALSSRKADADFSESDAACAFLLCAILGSNQWHLPCQA